MKRPTMTSYTKTRIRIKDRKRFDAMVNRWQSIAFHCAADERIAPLLSGGTRHALFELCQYLEEIKEERQAH